jgi:hypothetical protein
MKRALLCLSIAFAACGGDVVHPKTIQVPERREPLPPDVTTDDVITAAIRVFIAHGWHEQAPVIREDGYSMVITPWLEVEPDMYEVEHTLYVGTASRRRFHAFRVVAADGFVSFGLDCIERDEDKTKIPDWMPCDLARNESLARLAPAIFDEIIKQAKDRAAARQATSRPTK